MRPVWAVLAALVLTATCALAQDDDAPAPPAPKKSVDSTFISYSQPVIAFTHAEIVDGTGAAPKYDQTLIVRNGRIFAIGPAARTKVPAGAAVIDAHGKTLLPGFVMVHEHLFYPTGRYDGMPLYGSMLFSFPRLYLAGGTTTARTAGSLVPYGDINVKRDIDSGKGIGPDLDATAPYLNGTGIPILQMQRLAGPQDAKRSVNYWADEGFTSYKAYVDITRDELAAAIGAAHARGLKVTGHLCSVTYREAAERGIDDLEHGFAVMTDFVVGKQPDICPKDGNRQSLIDLRLDDPRLTSLMRFLIAHHVAITSTLTVFETFTPGRPEAPLAAREMLVPELREAYEKQWAAVPGTDRFKPWAVIFPKLMKMEKMYADMGGTLLAGTDPTGYGGVVPGFAGKREVELLVEAGLPFPQALKIATLNGAVYLGRAGEVGSLAAGKRADIAVVAGDPVKNPAAVEHMPLVFKKGVGYDTARIFAAMKGQVGLY